MTTGSDKPKTDDERDAGRDKQDAAELAGTKRRDGERDEDKAPPGAVSPEDLTTESDDGAS